MRELVSGFCTPPGILKVHIFKSGGSGDQITPVEKMLHEVAKRTFESGILCLSALVTDINDATLDKLIFHILKKIRLG